MNYFSIRKLLNVLALITCSITVQAQSKEYSEIMNWLADNHIEINNPTPPPGFQKFRDCNSNVVYKQRSGDTITFYTSGETNAVVLEQLAKLQKKPFFNITFYPFKVQENTIFISYMKPQSFLLRNDSLYVLDNSVADIFQIEELLTSMETYLAEKVDSLQDDLYGIIEKGAAKWKDSIQAANTSGLKKTINPKYPILYNLVFHKNMFQKSNSIILERQPFAYQGKLITMEERVDLVKEWKQNDRIYYLVRIYGEAGNRDLVFNTQGEFPEWENCQANKAEVLASIDSVMSANAADTMPQRGENKMYRINRVVKTNPAATVTGDVFATATIKDKTGLIDKKGNIVVPIKYHDVYGFKDGMALVTMADRGLYRKHGYVNKNGKEVIPLIYGRANPFSEGLACVALEERGENTKWGYIDKLGKLIVPLKYTGLDDDFKEGRARISVNGKSGFIDKTGKEVIPPQYDYISYSFREGLAIVSMLGKAAIIDTGGRLVTPFKHNSILDFKNGFATVEFVHKYGMIDKSGREIVAAIYDQVSGFTEGFMPVSLYGKYGFVNTDGKRITSLKYDYVGTFFGGFAAVFLKGKGGFIDKTGRQVIPLKYDLVSRFIEEVAWVRLQDKYGYIDKNAKEVIAVKYDTVSDFHNGLAPVRLENKYGYINKKGSGVIPFAYDNAGDFADGVAIVKLKGKWGLINMKGRQIAPAQYDIIDNFIGGLARVNFNNRWGFIDTAGRVVVPIIYEEIGYFWNGLASVLQNDKWGFIDKKGTLVIPLKYDKVGIFL